MKSQVTKLLIAIFLPLLLNGLGEKAFATLNDEENNVAKFYLCSIESIRTRPNERPSNFSSMSSFILNAISLTSRYLVGFLDNSSLS